MDPASATDSEGDLMEHKAKAPKCYSYTCNDTTPLAAGEVSSNHRTSQMPHSWVIMHSMWIHISEQDPLQEHLTFHVASCRMPQWLQRGHWQQCMDHWNLWHVIVVSGIDHVET